MALSGPKIASRRAEVWFSGPKMAFRRVEMRFSGPKETFPPAEMWFSGPKVPPQLTELPLSAPKAASPFTGMWLSGLPDSFSLKNLFSSLHRFHLNPRGQIVGPSSQQHCQRNLPSVPVRLMNTYPIPTSPKLIQNGTWAESS